MKEFIKVRSFKDVVLASALIVIGSICMVVVKDEGIKILGFFCLLIGLLFLFLLKTGYRDIDTGAKFTKSEHYFAQSIKDQIVSQLNSNPTSLSFAEENKGNGLRLDIYKDSQGNTYYQLFEYIPHKYEPCTEVFKTE